MNGVVKADKKIPAVIFEWCVKFDSHQTRSGGGDNTLIHLVAFTYRHHVGIAYKRAFVRVQHINPNAIQ